MFWRVVMWPLSSGAYFSITSANASIWSGVTPPSGSLHADHLDVGLALAVDALLEAEADELLLGLVAAHEARRPRCRSRRTRARGSGSRGPGRPRRPRGSRASRACPCRRWPCGVDVELVLGGDALGRRALLGRAVGSIGASITQIPTGFRAFSRTSPRRRASVPDADGGGASPAARRLVAVASDGRAQRSVDVGALDQERDPDVGAVLVEVVAADPGADDVDGADVAQRALGLASAPASRRRRWTVFELPTSSMILTTATSSSSCSVETLGWVCMLSAAQRGSAAEPQPRRAGRRAADALEQRGALPAARRGGRRRRAGAVSARNCSTRARRSPPPPRRTPRLGDELDPRAAAGCRSSVARHRREALAASTSAAVRDPGVSTPRRCSPPSPRPTAIERTRRAFERHARGEWEMPPKVYLDSPPNGDFRAMPARGDGPGAAQVGDVVSGQPGARPAGRRPGRAALRRRDRRAAGDHRLPRR